MSTKNIRHVLGLSGGKDSSALAIFMRDRVPEMEYFFTDTGAELPETYEYLDRLEGFLGKPIARLSAERNFDHLLHKVHNNFLPSPSTRWCTTAMKIEPFERWVGDDVTRSYIGIRADEPRDGYKSTKPNITPIFPFKEHGLGIGDIQRILAESGLGIPDYYKWRSRSGCYFCFFQRKSEWVGLAKNHPDLFERAKSYEKPAQGGVSSFTWSQGESLEQLIARAADIESDALQRSQRAKRLTWQEILAEAGDDQEDESCLICSL
jgi:3'-phosphoadenosine 5'-phosphosulfate sulfotransferase (PAPS reductase)/FAD synthetase